MFNRNKLLVTLLAVILLSSFIGGGIELLKKFDWNKHVVAVMPVFDSATYQESIHSLVDQTTGLTLGTDSNEYKVAGKIKRRHGGRKSLTATDVSAPYELAGCAKTLDPAGRVSG